MAVVWCGDGQLILDGASEERRPFEAADADFLDEQSAAYTRALTLSNPAGTLLTIGKALHDWLDRKDCLAQIIGASGPVSLDLAVAIRPDASARAFVAAPWELLTDAAGLHLAFDATRAYSPARRFGTPGTPWEPAHRDLSVLFMAAAPEGEHDLAYEREEALILDAVERLPVQLAVEESGSLGPLADRLALEGPFEVLHLTCHGTLVEGRGVLALEDEKGGLDRVGAERLCTTMGRHRPPLVLVSACRSAEQAGAAVPLALALMESGVPQVIGWAGSVYDSDAIAFARALYGALGRRETLPAAAAIARRALVEALQRDPEGTGQHWHLARVHLGLGGGGPLCTNGKPARVRPLGDKPFLDRKQQVPVAAPAVYVGRRREAQAVLRAFAGLDGPAGVLVRGMGRLGKSSLAARIARRRADLRSAVVFGRYDARAIFDELVEAIDARHRAALRTTWLDEIARDPRALKDAVEAVLTGPAAAPDRAAGHQPILLVIDDLERVLEPPRPGESRTMVKAEVRAPLRAVIEAFAAARTVTESRLLLTSRYAFSLPASRGDCADALLDLQVPPLTEGQRRKLARAELSRGRPEAEVNEEAGAMAGRALAAAAGNPGLQALLTRPILTDPDAAEAAIAAVESYRASGAMPEGDVGQFFSELALTTYRDALTPDEACAMRAARAFTLAVPRVVMETAAGVLGVSAPAGALDRLIGLGCLDVFQDGETTDLTVNALAAPLFAEPEADELARIARAIVSVLASTSTTDQEGFWTEPVAIELLRLAEAAGNAPAILVSAATSAAVRAWFSRNDARTAFGRVQKALGECDRTQIPPTFALLEVGIACASWLGDGTMQDVLAAKGLLLTNDSNQAARARFLAGYGNRLRQKGHIDETLNLYREEVLPTFERLGDVRSRAAVLHRVAGVLFARGDLDDALRIYRDEVLPAFEQLRAMRDCAATLSGIADVLIARGDSDEGLRIYRDEVLPAFERLNDVRERAVTLSKVADVLADRDDLDEALRIFCVEVLPAFRQLGDVRECAVAWGKIADISFIRGDLDKVLRIYRCEVLPALEQLGDVRECAIAWSKIAGIFATQGDLDAAITIYRKEVFPVSKILNDDIFRIITLRNIANALSNQGDFDEALRIYREDVLPEIERQGDVREICVTLGNISDALFGKGELDEAMRILINDVFPIYDRLNDLSGLCHTHFGIAKIRITQELSTENMDREAAQDILERSSEAYRLAEHLGHAEAIAVVGTLFGQVLSLFGQASKARTILTRAAWTSRKLGRQAEATKIDALIASLPPPPAEPTT